MEKSKQRIYLIMENGEKYSVEAHEALDNRSKYYAEKDSDTTYEEEYEAFREDEFEAYDWLVNNMNWWECKTMRKEETRKIELSELEIEGYYLKSPL